VKKPLIYYLQDKKKHHIWLAAVVLATLLTLPIVAGFNFLLEDRVTARHLMTGFVAAVLVASIISALVIYFLQLLSQIQQDNLHLNDIINACPVPIAIIDNTSNIPLLNPEFIKVFGYTVHDIPTIQDLWLKAYPDADYRQSVMNAWQIQMQVMFATGEAFNSFEVKIHCKNGQTKTVLAAATPLEPAHLGTHLIVLYDISEKSQRSDTLLESRNILQTIIETIPMRVFWKDLDSRYLGCNSAFARDADLASPNEIIGKLDSELSWHAHADLYRADDRAVMQTRTPRLAYDEPQTTPNGQTIWLRTSKTALYDNQSEVIGILGVYDDITERKKIEKELWLTKTMLDSSKKAFYRLDASGNIQYVNDHACQALGYSREELLNMHPWDFDPDFDASAWPAAWQKLKTDITVNFETRHRRRDGSLFNVDLIRNYISYNGEEFCFSIAQDITERKRIETELNIAATAFESQEGMVITDASTVILKVNHSFTRITGFTSDDVVGHKMTILKSNVHDAAFYAGMWATVFKTGFWQGEIWNRRKNGDIYPEWLIITAVKNTYGQVSHYVGTINDITSRKAIEAEIQHMAHYDALTDLPNRILLTDRLHQALAQVRREKVKLGLMYLDLDKFKPVNDNLGHDIGDLLLKEVAHRLQKCMKRESDTVSRLGGDEFVILLARIGDDQEAADAANNVVNTLNLPFEIKQHTIHISSSVGIAIYPTHALDGETLMKLADNAMYQAKDAGGSCFRYYQSTE
jgi:diguanylate cyclase (GGDEF)-like protein/PAS domain S-box-containing protein